jgi:GT2 family glycosyltransferase
MEPIVSILMPTYEPNPHFLREAIQSVLAQTEARWTLLINDDASSMDVRSMIQEFLSDPRITFCRNPLRLGIGGNWNACLQEATTPFVQFLFQDDVWNKDYLKTSLERLESDPSLGFVSTTHAYQSDKALPRSYHFVERERAMLPSGKQTGKAFLKKWLQQGLYPNILGEPSFVMFRKTLINQTGAFDESLKQCLDLDMWVRMLERSDVFIEQTSGGSFRVHLHSASVKNGSSTERLQVLSKALGHSILFHPILMTRLLIRWIQGKLIS